MKYTKKIFAVLSIATILLSHITNATNAPIDNSLASINLSGNATADVLTVSNVTKDFSTDNVKLYVIKNNSGTVIFTGTTVTTNIAGGFTVSNDFDAILTNAFSGSTSTGSSLAPTFTRYNIAYQTVSGDIGGAVLVVNHDDTLTVVATVLPVLKFELERTDKDFGVLTTSYTGVTTGIEVGTNAVNGVTVTAKTKNGGLKSTTANHVINLTGNDPLYANEGYQFSSTATGVSDSVVGAVMAGSVVTTMNTANQVLTVYTADKPQNFDTGSYDSSFAAQVRIATSTPAASDYQDSIIFTVTANF